MQVSKDQYNCTLDGSEIVISHVDGTRELTIHMKRTIRVLDTKDGSSFLPPALGNFPLYKVSDYAHKLPVGMVREGGLFMPIYQREALWINFSARSPFAIKVFVGGINAVSGEPIKETAATRDRRRALRKQAKSLQDYIVVPEQLWLDGVACGDGFIKQFVAMPLGDGYSVEAQLTGQEVTGGFQFEITPSTLRTLPWKAGQLLDVPPAGTMEIFVKDLNGKVTIIRTNSHETTEIIKARIYNRMGMPPDQQGLIFAGRQLLTGYMLSEQNVQKESTLHLLYRLKGGGDGGTARAEMAVGAGGRVKQVIHLDRSKAETWLKDKTMVFNVQLLNSRSFTAVTGLPAPESPISAATYRQYGLPFFKMYEEETGISWDSFGQVKSVAEMDGVEEQDVEFPVKVISQGDAGEPGPESKKAKTKTDSDEEVLNKTHRDMKMITLDADSLINPSGPSESTFRHVSELERELDERSIASFQSDAATLVDGGIPRTDF